MVPMVPTFRKYSWTRSTMYFNCILLLHFMVTPVFVYYCIPMVCMSHCPLFIYLFIHLNVFLNGT